METTEKKPLKIEKNRSRWYKCSFCGSDHPSITTLLSVIASPALMGWVAKNGTTKLNVLDQVVKEKLISRDDLYGAIRILAEERWKLTETTDFWKSGKQSALEAADYGMMAHAWIEAYLCGKAPTLESLPIPAQKVVSGFLEWSKEHHLEVLKTEETFYNCKLNYAGTADIACKLDGELSLGDWKSSTAIFSNHVIQTWAYALGDEMQNAERLYRQVFIGRFGKDGDWEVKIFKRNAFPSIETARDVMTGCGQIFGFLQEYDRRFPYVKKPKGDITS